MGNAESYDAQRRLRRRFREAFFSDGSEVISADGARTVNAGEDVAIAPQLSERRKRRGLGGKARSALSRAAEAVLRAIQATSTARLCDEGLTDATKIAPAPSASV